MKWKNVCKVIYEILQFISILLDFELAMMNAALNIFPNTAIKGYLFHFYQTIKRKIVNSGLREAIGHNLNMY